MLNLNCNSDTEFEDRIHLNPPLDGWYYLNRPLEREPPVGGVEVRPDQFRPDPVRLVLPGQPRSHQVTQPGKSLQNG